VRRRPISKLIPPAATRRAVFRKWADDLGAGVLKALNEIQVENEFYNLLKSLGYASHADVPTGQAWTLQPKWYITGVGPADAALGHFANDASGKLTGAPLVVVELERPGKDLDRKESTGRSPVQQAWDYLNGSESAQWAIVYNGVEFRLYSRQRTSRHIYRVALVNLKDLDTFDEFYAVVHADSLLGTGTLALNAEKLLQQTGERQETVSDKLYEEYAEKRVELIRELQANSVADLDQAIQTAQRLLDRILFIAFAEDRGLLPNAKPLEHMANIRGHAKSLF
jgi:hypothetical protein